MNQNKAYGDDGLPSYAQVALPAEARYVTATGYVTTARYEVPQTSQTSEAPSAANSPPNKVSFSLKTCFIIIAVAIAINFMLVIAFGGVLFHLQANSATKSEVSQIAAQNRLPEGFGEMTDPDLSPTSTRQITSTEATELPHLPTVPISATTGVTDPPHLPSSRTTERTIPVSTTERTMPVANTAITPQSPPSWFTGDTELCYRWRADVTRSGQCGDGVNTELCANVGTYTTNYRDDTDSRSGGCRMQWSIRSPSADEQFDGVRVCYRWSADGNSGQCGGGADSLLCAPVGNYTPEYQDNTDSRPGGCQMSWMLSVPADAPQWLRDVQLCYRWFPDGNGGQCGGGRGLARELCARANSWTPFYRDDTDNRGGGCQMAWKLM